MYKHSSWRHRMLLSHIWSWFVHETGTKRAVKTSRHTGFMCFPTVFLSSSPHLSCVSVISSDLFPGFFTSFPSPVLLHLPPPAPHLHYSSLYLGPVLSSACVGLSVVFARYCCWFLIRLPPLIFLQLGPASFALSVTASLFYMILNWFPLNFKHSTGQKKQFFRWHLGLGELVKAYFSIFWHLTE